MTLPTTDSYRVRLDAFEGPLDLLLYLIRKNEVDVHDIPMATIAEQYLGHLHEIRSADPARIDIDTAGEFLVMAATLMEIKSRMLMPAAPAADAALSGAGGGAGGSGGGVGAADPRAELVRQLLEYKQFRDAADALEHRGEEWRRRFPVSPAALDAEALRSAVDSARDVEMEDLELIDLVEAFRKIAETVNFDRLGDHQVTYDDTPLELHAEDILDTVRREAMSDGPDAVSPPELAFSRIFDGRTRGQMVGLFIAMLELVRRRAIAFRVDHGDGRIFVRLRPHEDATPATDPPAASIPTA